MKLLNISAKSAEAQFSSMMMVANAASDGMGRPQDAVVHALHTLLSETELDIATLTEIEPATLQRCIQRNSEAKQLVRFMVIISLAEGRPNCEQVALIKSFAKALGVKEPAVKVVNHLARNRIWRFRFSFFPHSHLRNYFRNTYRITGAVRHVAKGLLVFRGKMKETSLSERFRALEHLSRETLGYHFFDHMVQAGLAFPGEKGGFPIGAVYHDFTHVLSGYDTTPEGEMRNAAFQAGYTQDDDDFFVALFAILIHTAGINVTPFEMPVLLGRIGQDNLALEMFHAMQRGSRMTVDLGASWDFWQYVEQPIAMVREQLGIVPVADKMAPA
jgi:hypothetical protein